MLASSYHIIVHLSVVVNMYSQCVTNIAPIPLGLGGHFLGLIDNMLISRVFHLIHNAPLSHSVFERMVNK